MFGTKETQPVNKGGMAMLAETMLKSMVGAEGIKQIFDFFQSIQTWTETMDKRLERIELSIENISDRIGRLEAAQRPIRSATQESKK